MTSLWRDRPAVETDHELDEVYDDLVVGGGLTGLTIALLLARAGRRVAVVEARQVGAVTTGHTTGKVSLLQGTKLSSMSTHHTSRVVEAYVEANREGQAWLLRFCEEHGVPVQRRDAVTYAADSGSGLRQARAELDAATSAGLNAHWEDTLPVPFEHFGGVVLPDQAQLDAMDLVAALVEQVREAGGRVVENRRVVTCSRADVPVLTLDDGATVRGETVVLATGTPVLDRGLYFGKLEPRRSYALAFRHPEPTELMLLAAGSPSRSVRSAPRADGPRLLVGGEGHVVGRTRSEKGHLDRLRAWTAEHYPGALETHAWSAQDYASHDGLPFVGPMPRGGGHIYVATGYDKWGMTNGIAAALNLAAQILRQERPSWGDPIAHRITGPRGALQIARVNAAVGLALTRGLVRAELHSAPVAVAEGEGVVGRACGLPVGRATVEGSTCAVRAVCTHLGGVLTWNDAERSWDCPLHGSRFAPDGTVLEGPATRPLPRANPGGA